MAESQEELEARMHQNVIHGHHIYKDIQSPYTGKHLTKTALLPTDSGGTIQRLSLPPLSQTVHLVNFSEYYRRGSSDYVYAGSTKPGGAVCIDY